MTQRPRPDTPTGPDEGARQVDVVSRFPDQNPNPVLRMTDAGVLTYANLASADVLAATGCSVGDAVPEGLLAQLRDAGAAGDGATVEVVGERRTFALLPVPVADFGFVNIYGTDVTAARVLARFPDRNPNPVFRVSEEGVLLYANLASRQVTSSFGCEVGQRLPEGVRGQINGTLDGTLPPSFEVDSHGRTYELLPVRITEFGFINVYGTDVTARRAMNKFPDQNPNAVLRVSQDGRLVYANAASAPIHRAFGAEVGDALAPEWFARIRERLERDADDVLEVASEGRIFAVLVKNVYEFSFINLYGTDITAARMVEEANAENERLLLNILPAPIAARLRAGERVIADRFDDVTLLFADIVDFTTMSSEMSPAEVVDILNDVFSLFDELVDRHRLEKIKTIGDAYMVVGGLAADPEDHTARVAAMALDLATAVARVKRRSGGAITIRVGIHRGPVVAGVIGTKKFIYDVWGDTVNIASRMESHGVPGRIQVTAAVVDRLEGAFEFESRGVVEVKGKGRLPTWFLARRSPSAGSALPPGPRDVRPPA